MQSGRTCAIPIWLVKGYFRMKNKRHIKNIGKKRLHMMSKTMNNNFELSQWLCHDESTINLTRVLARCISTTAGLLQATTKQVNNWQNMKRARWKMFRTNLFITYHAFFLFFGLTGLRVGYNKTEKMSLAGDAVAG